MSERKGELVVILHGIGMSALRMIFLEHAIKRAGYDTLNINYPSRSKSIEDCADFAQEKITNFVKPEHSKIHFAAHSMGTLVTLELLTRKAFDKASRAVLIAPPYKGSEMADFLDGTIGPVYRWWFGPAGEQLKTSYRANRPYELPDTVELGVIAGTVGWHYPHALYAMRHSKVHDGLVSMGSTQIPTMKDSITIRTSHSLLIESSRSQMVHFLDHGRFNSELR